jgi:agmatine deiminase
MKFNSIGRILPIMAIYMLIGERSYSQSYRMPHENETHEGTWLQWPHQFEYGIAYRNSLDDTWIAMTAALVAGEKVHIIAYNEVEKNRIIDLLNDANVSLENVDFFLFPTNDVWIRDNGPIFVYNESEELLVQDWGFNGWGGKFNYELCDPIPTSIGNEISIPIIDLSDVMTNEGGAVDTDGNGVMMACKSSIISQSPMNSVRNPGMTLLEAEEIFAQYLGVTKFIWLDGNVGDAYDVTDFHIDGFAKFVNDSIMVTMNTANLSYWGASNSDIDILYSATNSDNETYQKIYLPLTQNNVVTTYFFNLGFKGSYVNYYVANEVVLVPNYNDPNDDEANEIIAELYPGREVVGIDVRNLYESGGMVHCVTQQQPANTGSSGLNELNQDKPERLKLFPNPCSTRAVLSAPHNLSIVSVTIENGVGQKVIVPHQRLDNTLIFDLGILEGGLYYVKLVLNNQTTEVVKMVVAGL